MGRSGWHIGMKIGIGGSVGVVGIHLFYINALSVFILFKAQIRNFLALAEQASSSPNCGYEHGNANKLDMRGKRLSILFITGLAVCIANMQNIDQI
jgi:hypothetical protein